MYGNVPLWDVSFCYIEGPWDALNNIEGGIFMASSYTEHYRLNQWEADDPVRRVDFNADNAKIDAAIKDVADGLSEEVSARTQAVSAEASARMSAVSSLNYSLSRRGNCDVRTSSYTGDGSTTRTLSFSSAPKFIVIIGPQAAAFVSGTTGTSLVQDSSRGTLPTALVAAWNGSQVTLSPAYSSTANALMNTSGASYQVISFHNVS